MKSVVGVGAGLIGLAVVAYPSHLRKRCLTWGATAGEAVARMPGDDLLPDADVVATRAISIDAPAGAVWPWLVQMGSGRGGAYTYDWIENLFGLGMHSADRIIPEFQGLKVGDAFRLGPGRPPMHVEVLEPERALVFRFEDGTWVWSFGLTQWGGTTRLVSRNRIATPNASHLSRALSALLMEPGSLVMERKMLLGIKQRAERLAVTRHPPGGDRPAP
jgi:hypothetical protein